MSWWRRLALAALGLGVLAALLLRLRPARLLGAHVTSVTPGVPPVASLALTYGRGARPYSLIVDVRGTHGAVGSATVDGRQEFAELPLIGAAGGPYVVAAETTQRVLGRLMVRRYRF